MRSWKARCAPSPFSDHPLPTQIDHSVVEVEVLTGIKDCMHDLQLCDQVAPDSVERLSMRTRTVAETLLLSTAPLVLSRATPLGHADFNQEIISARSLGEALAHSRQELQEMAEKDENNPIQTKARTNKQKDKYARKCGMAGNYSKANTVRHRRTAIPALRGRKDPTTNTRYPAAPEGLFSSSVKTEEGKREAEGGENRAKRKDGD